MELAHCKRDFDFKPLNKTESALPAIAWNGYLLSGFDRPNGTAINLRLPLPQLMKDCYPKLTFVELVRFLEKLELHPELLSSFKEPLLAVFNLKDHPELDEVMALVLILPFELQNWIAQRDLGPRELYPLRMAFKRDVEAGALFLGRLFLALQERKASRQQTSRVIEVASDLVLLGRDPLALKGRTIEIWLRNLENAIRPSRRPARPSIVRARWVQENEKGGIEVKFDFQSSNPHNALTDELDLPFIDFDPPQSKN